MNYYNEIKNKLIENEIYAKVKDYSKERHKVLTYYEIGKILNEAGSKYGEGIIKEYSSKLTNELGTKYSVRYLFDMKKLYLFLKVHPVGAQLTMSHYRLLFSLNDDNEINYYINQVSQRNLSKRELETIIKSKEYERLEEPTKLKLMSEQQLEVKDLIPNPIVIPNKNNYEIISEKILQKIILEDVEAFMKALGNSFSFIGSEYKIKIGDTYNYIDLLLFNYEYNCFIVIELKVTELKKEHIGQIQVYMNYIDNNLKKVIHDKTIGIIICKKNNKYIIEYCSDSRIITKEYKLV